MKITDLRFEFLELTNSVKQEAKRIDQLEEGAEVDLTHLQVDGAGLKELFRIMQELKTEIMQKTASRDHIRQLEIQLEEIKQHNIYKKL